MRKEMRDYKLAVSHKSIALSALGGFHFNNHTLLTKHNNKALS